MSHIRDRWMTPGPNGRKVRNERWGKGRRWLARWTVAGVERTLTFATKDAAEAHLAHIATGVPAKAAAPSLSAYAEQWQRGQLHYTESTHRAVSMRMRVSVLPSLGHLPLDEIDRAQVQEVLSDLAQTHAASTVRMTASFLSTMFQCAVEDGLIPVSPCVKVRVPPKRRQQIVPLTADQVQAITAAVDPRYRAMVALAAATGLRGGELRGLTWDRVKDGRVRVDRQMLGVKGGQPVYGPPKSDASVRVVAMGEVAAGVLEQHRARARGDLVFLTRESGPVNRNRAAEIWRAATAGMDLRPRSGWHDLRHFNASALIAAGLSPRAVADRLGHSDPAETLRSYAHLWPSDQDRALAAIDQILVRLWSVEVSVDPTA